MNDTNRKNKKIIYNYKKGVDFMDEQGNFAYGLVWGTSLSVPLWIAFFGWIKLIIRFIF